MRRCNFSFAFLTLLFCVLASASSTAQTVTSSAYSRYGIGEYANKTFAQSAALGGTYIALQNDSFPAKFINAANPASYSSIRHTTFEVGVNSIFNKFSTTNTHSQSNNTTFNYLALAVPLGRQFRGGACVGVMPYSNVGYTINRYTSVDNIGTVKETYTGDGGVNQLFMGVSINPFSKQLSKYRAAIGRTVADSALAKLKHNYRQKIFMKRWISSIALGGNANYHFGTINNGSRVIYPSTALYFNTAQTTQTVIKGFSANFGFQSLFTIDSIQTTVRDTVKSSPTFRQKFKVRRNLKQDVYICLGYTYSLNNSLRTEYTNFAYTFLYQSNGISEYVRDTVQLLSAIRAPLTLPAMHGVGISIRKGTKLNVLADFETQLWSGFRYINQGSLLQNSKRVSVGVEYIPKKVINSKSEGWKRINFRAGAHYSDGNLLINNTRLNEYGASLGIGVPVGLGRVFNTFNITSEFGQIGTTKNNLVKQQYIRVKIGFTFNDRWFVKFKYD